MANHPHRQTWRSIFTTVVVLVVLLMVSEQDLSADLPQQNPVIQSDSFIYLPVTFRQNKPPILNMIINDDQDNYFTVTWGSTEATSYILEESKNAFASSKVVYQGSDVSWDVPIPGYIPGTYYYRVKAKSYKGDESEWSNIRSVTIYPLFVGQQLRWDGSGYLQDQQYYMVGYHLERSIDSLIDSDTVKIGNLEWYDPNPLGWSSDSWTTYRSVSTGYSRTSSGKSNSAWKWGYTWIVPYDIQLHRGEWWIDDVRFNVTGPHSGFTAFGQAVEYWRFINKERFLMWDDGGDWRQYVKVGDAELHYDAGNSRLLLHSDVKRTWYYQSQESPYYIHYIYNLTSSNSFPAGVGRLPYEDSSFSASSLKEQNPEHVAFKAVLPLLYTDVRENWSQLPFGIDSSVIKKK